MMVLWFILAWVILVITVFLIALATITLTVWWQDRKVRKEINSRKIVPTIDKMSCPDNLVTSD